MVRSWRGREVHRMAQDVTAAQEELLTELLAVLGVEMEAELHVTVRAREGIPQDRVRVVLENAKALGVKIEVV
jgi:hypothetical protein